MDRSPVDDFLGGCAELHGQLIERGRKTAKFVKESRALAHQDMVQKIIPGGGALRHISPEEPALQRFDGRKVREASPAFAERDTCGFEFGGKTKKKVGGNGNRTPGANQLAPHPQRKRIVQCYAHHGIAIFPVTHTSVKEMVFFPGQRRDPIVRHISPFRKFRPVPPKKHAPSEECRQYTLF